MNRHRLWLCVTLLFTASAAAQDEDDELPPGLLATYTTKRDGAQGDTAAKNQSVQRVDPDIAFVWDNASPDERLAAGPFRAEWSGRILLRGEGRTRWHAFVQGKVEVRIDDKVVVSGETEKPTWVSGNEVELGFGEKPFSVTFTRTSDAAQLKLYWSSNEFPLEPLPYHVFFHEKPAPEIALAERGRVQFESHRCANCHGRVDVRGSRVEGQTKSAAASQPFTLNPQLFLPAPSLKHVGQGTGREWLIDKLMIPSQSEGKMPHFGFMRDEAAAIVAALIEQAQTVKLDAPPKLKDAERDTDLKEGLTLIRSVGCLACHSHGALGEATPFGGGPLTDISQRRSADWLATWLAKPTQINEHARMPIVSLSDKERAQIVMTLLVPSPPSSGERARVRGPNGEQTPEPQTKTKETPHPNPLPSKARGEGTGMEDPAQVARGRKLIETSRCSACHEFATSQPLATRPRSLARGDLDWKQSCLTAAGKTNGRPHVPQADAQAIQGYVASWSRHVSSPLPFNRQLSTLYPCRLLEQKNCLACHDRDGTKGLSRLAASIAKADETLSGLHMTLIPPRLNAVGDRIRDEALTEAISGAPKSPRLSWLRVRMPRFQHTDAEKAALVSYLIGHDRVPSGVEGRGLNVEGTQLSTPDSLSSTINLQPSRDPQTLLAGRELLGGKGFSCVACHAVKDYTPKVTALGTRGSNLHLLGQRMRPEYYLRWTRAPLRIMPGVEMPNYQRPHPTILAGKIDQQLDAIWQALNDPNLTSPTNPAVVEQLLAVNKGERPRIVRDVFTVAGTVDDLVPRAFAVGLDNGHSVLFDLDTGCLRAWTLGDFARQRCEGKRWFWDLAGSVIASRFDKRPEILFIDNKSGEVISPENGWQFETQFESYHDEFFTYRLTVQKGDVNHLVHVREDYSPDSQRPSLGWSRLIAVRPVGFTPMTITPWHRGTLPETLHNTATITLSTDTITTEGPEGARPKELPVTAHLFARRRHQAPFQSQPDYFQLLVHYATTLERVEAASPNPPAPPLVSPADRITSVPGFRAERLPLPRSIMPTAMTFDDQSRLIFTSLKGHVYRVDSPELALSLRDRKADEPTTPDAGSAHLQPQAGVVTSLPPRRGEATKPNTDDPAPTLTLLAEGLAAPFGVMWMPRDAKGAHPAEHRVLVAHKPELLTLYLKPNDKVAEREVLATGWGITDDYHDWTCGIAKDSQGNLFTVLGSDYAFKARPKDKSRWRGDALRIDPLGRITSIAKGLRFPTGIAMDDQDRLFVTDQQGVQNTFNELNYIQTGHRYGVPSRHEPEPEAAADPPAVQIPHPWTRSVNGVAFVPRRLSTPARPATEVAEKRTGKSAHPTGEARPLDPLAGHFLAAEYNNNSIIRMSVQDVDGVVQGAVYPFSKPTSDEAPLSATPGSGGKPQSPDSSSFIGPICIGISRTGDIYVGGFQDGGWAGGLNMGDIVKLTPEDALPNGIREIRVTSRGFDLEFMHPVDPELARQTSHYKISGYTRVWKGDYATPDSGRHNGEVTDATLDDAARTVSLTVTGIKPGHVYDVSVGEIGSPNQRVLWPSLGHYTLHRIPR